MAEDHPATLTLAEAVEEYLDWQAVDRGRSPNSVRAYGTDLAGFRAYAGAAGVEQLAGVDRDLLREFQVAMARGRRGAKPLAPQTRHRRLVALRSFLRFCAREDGSSSVSTPVERPASTISRWPTNRFWSS
ncbi:MAG TPA: site-specific integrase [Patescibacteria group bacterium]|nr:site-specific integrase [Patescibacteria group bacterium]